MRGLGFALLPAGALFAAAAASGSCTATTSPSFPLGAEVVPASFTTLSVAGLPPSCSGQVFYEASTALCPPGLTYFLCDGNSYTEYDCTNPGSGWTLETLSQYDRVATGPSPCGNGSGGGGGGASSLSGTVYVESTVAARAENAIIAFRYCDGALPPLLTARVLTGGSGAADLDDRGVLDADQQVVVNASQTLLFAVNQGSDTIAAFHIAGDGSLTPVTGSPFPSGGPAPASVGVSGNILVVANKAADGIRDLHQAIPNYTTFSIQSDGSLKPTGSTYALPLGASPTQAFVAPGGKLVFGTEESYPVDGGTENGVLRAFQLSPEGDLTLAQTPVWLANSLFPAGRRPQPVWPAGLSAAPNQSFLYTGIPNNNSIATFQFTDSGQLSLIGGEADWNAALPCWSVVSADGRRLYFANAGSDNISVWDIATKPQRPSLLQTYELPGGGNPWGLRLDSTGQLLFVITPRQVHQVPQDQGQLLHGLSVDADGTLDDEVDGSPVTIPVAPASNVYGVTVVAQR
jgi:6-phosphogluconolactonase (cycloisomerase 2 family)